MNDLFQTLSDRLTQIVPDGSVLLPLGGAAAAALLGLLMVLKGAKLAPALTALILAGSGGWASSAVATTFSVPFWPAAIVGAALGAVLGLALFKVWMSLMVAACFIAAALTFYGAKVLAPHVATYVSERRAALADETAAAPPSLSTELGGAWSYLGQNVTNFQPSVYAIVLSSGLAGIVFGLLVTGAARALWAATIGTLLALIGTCVALKLAAPPALEWLASIGGWGWTIVAAVWAFGLIHNFLDVRARHGKRVTDDSAEPAAAA